MKNICCKAFSCTYNFKGSYCLNPLPSFDNRGYCNFFWHSSPNMVQETKKDISEKNFYIDEFIVVDGETREVEKADGAE